MRHKVIAGEVEKSTMFSQLNCLSDDFLISKKMSKLRNTSAGSGAHTPSKEETLINPGADLMSTKALLNASVSRGASEVEELERQSVCVCVCFSSE